MAITGATDVKRAFAVMITIGKMRHVKLPKLVRLVVQSKVKSWVIRMKTITTFVTMAVAQQWASIRKQINLITADTAAKRCPNVTAASLLLKMKNPLPVQKTVLMIAQFTVLFAKHSFQENMLQFMLKVISMKTVFAPFVTAQTPIVT